MFPAVPQNLSSIQADVLSAIRRRVDGGEPVPTYRELRDEFGWRSTATVRDHLKALARKGYLELSGRRHRQVRLLRNHVPVSRVPLLGTVIAGSQGPAGHLLDGYLPVPSEWISRGDHFALRMRGSSMAGAGILDGDYVIARHQSVAADGDIVVTTIDGETTLKRLKRTPSGFVLAAENPRDQSIGVRTETASVQGVVVGLMRSYFRIARTRRPSRPAGDLPEERT